MISASKLRDMALWTFGGAASTSLTGASLTAAGSKIVGKDSNQDFSKEALTTLIGCALTGASAGIAIFLLRHIPSNDPSKTMVLMTTLGLAALMTGPLMGKTILGENGANVMDTLFDESYAAWMVSLAAGGVALVGMAALFCSRSRPSTLRFFTTPNNESTQNTAETANFLREEVSLDINDSKTEDNVENTENAIIHSV